MYYHSAFVLLFAVGLILNCSGSYSATSSRQNNANVFNFLLGLYKINPMKSSPVFQSFSNDLLLGMGRGNKDHVVLNSESSESLIVNNHVKSNFKEIEKMIHTSNKKPANHFEKPAYDLDDVMSTENFKAEVVINDKVLSKEEFQRTLMDDHNMMDDDISSVLDHIGSNETDNEMPVTKLLPVKNDVVQHSQVANQNEAVFDYNKPKSDNHIDTLPKSLDRNPQDNTPKNNFVEEVGDVIVF